MFSGKLQALYQGFRPAGRRINRSKTATTTTSTTANTQSLDEIGRECTAVGNVLRLRAKEQSVETLLRERVYQEQAESFEQMKEICKTPPKKKKRSSKRNKKRAAEILAALTSASSNKKPPAATRKLNFSATKFLTRFRQKPSSVKIIRRHSFVVSCVSYPDSTTPNSCERSSKSFVNEMGHSVEAS
eukprot:g8304.t1